MDTKPWTNGDLKRKARSSLKRNYIISILICAIVAILTCAHSFIDTGYEAGDLGNAGKLLSSPRVDSYSNSKTVESYVRNIDSADNPVYDFLHKKTDTYANGVLSSLVRNSAQTGSVVFGVLNALNQFIFEDKVFAGIVIFTGVVLLLIYYLFAGAIVGTGEKRFFLETRTYSGTQLSRLFFLIKIRKVKNPVVVTLMRFVFTFLWFLTVAGGFIKLYSYRMVPYILAENPEIKWRDALSLSKTIMRGSKWRAFLLDLSFLPWYLLSLPTLGLLNVLYVTPYREAAIAELYITLRRQLIQGSATCAFYFNDLYLDAESDLDRYPPELFHIMEKPHRFFSLDYKKSYTITNLILLFFSFSIFGWLWEVLITFFQHGEFINRGVFWGPWLPIYGAGGVVLLILLKPLRDRPFLSFVCAMVICGIIEYFTAWYLEAVKHYSWWDYTGYLLNLHSRICLEGLLVFGLGGLFFIYFMAPLIDSYLNKIPLNVRKILCIILVFLFAADFVHSYNDPNTGSGIAKRV